MKTVERRVWIITYYLKDIDPKTGEEFNWSNSEQYYADTYAEAKDIKRKLLAGEHWYYGDLVEDCEISDGPKEVEFYA